VGSYWTVTADQPASASAPVAAPPPEDEPRGLHDLLRLQDLDLAVDRLRTRCAELEGGAEVAQAREHLARLDGAAGELQVAIEDVDREQQRLEHDVDSMSRKRKDEEKRLYDGSVANPKELQSIRAEVENIANRTKRVEDRVLELMEQREELDGRFTPAREEAAVAQAALQELARDSAEELDDIERSLATQAAARETIVPLIDEDLLALYEDLRRSKKGVGVAELRAGICQGCHQKLSPMELDRIKRASGVRRCDYCRRILVLV
jgi:predicted  nucleic acid-binding Zn-ribbon protein